MAKKSSNFYGSKIKTGQLHKDMGVKKGSKIPLQKINSRLHKLENKKTKTASDKKEIKRLVFAKNAKTKFHHKKK